MSRSGRTLAEFRAAASLLDMSYNPNYHMFQNFNTIAPNTNLDADTMEPINYENFNTRRSQVYDKQLGASDYDLEELTKESNANFKEM